MMWSSLSCRYKLRRRKRLVQQLILDRLYDHCAQKYDRDCSRSWATPVATLVGVGIVLLSAVLWGVDVVAQTFDGTLVAADYWGMSR